MVWAGWMNIVRCQPYDKGLLINGMRFNKKEDSLKSAWPLKEGKILERDQIQPTLHWHSERTNVQMPNKYKNVLNFTSN